MMNEKAFFELFQVATGRRSALSETPTDACWAELFDLAKRQTVAALLLEGVRELPERQWPPKDIVLQWTMMANAIKQQNLKTTAVCGRLTELLGRDGFDVCILKGQANHVYYDLKKAGWGNLRTCGDVDAWIRPQDKTKHPVRTIIDYLHDRNVIESLCYLHAEVTPLEGVPVEIHFRPSFLNAPWSDWRFNRLFEGDCRESAVVDGTVRVTKLRVDYDLIFQMNHIYRHLLDEGVGLRQVFDYYVLLEAYRRQLSCRDGLMNVDTVMRHVSACGMRRFASALMYVLVKVFGLDGTELLFEPSEKDGAFLLDEIMKAGNFGHYDKRMKTLAVRKGKLSYQLRKARRRFVRNLRFLTSYTEEVACEPFARVVHLLWRKFELYRFC